MTLHQFFEICYDFVQFYPTQQNLCKRLNTFAAIESYSDLNAANLGKTVQEIDKKFFYSRSWANNHLNPSQLDYDYPVMIAFDKSLALTNVMSPRSQTQYVIEIAFLDKHVQSVNSVDLCSNRNRNEIFKDTENFMMNFFEYLKDIVYIDSESKYISLAVLRAGGSVEEPNEAETRKIQKGFNDVNRNLFASRWEGGLDDLQGTFFEFNLSLHNCGKFQWNAETSSIEVSGDLGCCD